MEAQRPGGVHPSTVPTLRTVVGHICQVLIYTTASIVKHMRLEHYLLYCKGGFYGVSMPLANKIVNHENVHHHFKNGSEDLNFGRMVR